MKNHRSFRVEPPAITRLAADANIRPGHPAERVCWIWHPARRNDETCFLRFELKFRRADDRPLRCHVTADNRYQLFLDGEPVAYGPDRSDPAAWSVSTLEIPLTPGEHTLSAFVWLIAENTMSSRMDPDQAGGSRAAVNPPMAQMSAGGGFLFVADDAAQSPVFDTGCAPWKVADLTPALRFSGPDGLGYHDIGPGFHFDMKTWSESRRQSADASVVARPMSPNIHGVVNPGRALVGHDIPEQARECFTGGRIRAARPAISDAVWSETGDVAALDAVRGGRACEIAAGSQLEFLWDFGRYVCGYPEFAWSGGAGAKIEVEWAESLYSCDPANVDAFAPKGHRGEIEGKAWLGFGDSFIASGGEHEQTPGLWWRSGRYLRVRITTSGHPLRLDQLAIRATGYPLERTATWSSSDSGWDDCIPFLARGLELNAHEIWVDCPYYEQLNYVGDTIMHAASTYACYPDDRLTRRSLRHFDLSRRGSGLVAERHPSAWRQESATYAMLHPIMVRDFVWWRDDPDWVRAALLPGSRQLMEAVLQWKRADGLLGAVPGWPCVDWVRTHGWHECCGPGMREGDSSIVNLHFVLACRAQAEIERALGDPLLAQRWEAEAAGTFQAVMQAYWSPDRGCLLDTRSGTFASEHAQALAVLTGLLDSERRERIRHTLLADPDLARCTISFSFYLFEAFRMLGEGAAIFERIQFWRELPACGFVSLPECPEPNRSDCHAWGAHPLFHTFASIAGVRPAAPGFRHVRIEPLPGPLDRFSLTMPHPAGKIAFDATSLRSRAEFTITLPAGICGDLVWNSHTYAIAGRGTPVRLQPEITPITTRNHHSPDPPQKKSPILLAKITRVI